MIFELAVPYLVNYLPLLDDVDDDDVLWAVSIAHQRSIECDVTETLSAKSVFNTGNYLSVHLNNPFCQ